MSRADPNYHICQECRRDPLFSPMSTSGWWDVKRWVLSFGADAKVLEPIELRKEIVEELSAAEDRYK